MYTKLWQKKSRFIGTSDSWLGVIGLEKIKKIPAPRRNRSPAARATPDNELWCRSRPSTPALDLLVFPILRHAQDSPCCRLVFLFFFDFLPVLQLSYYTLELLGNIDFSRILCWKAIVVCALRFAKLFGECSTFIWQSDEKHDCIIFFPRNFPFCAWWLITHQIVS